MKPTILYSGQHWAQWKPRRTVISMELHGKTYVGTYEEPISALEEMAGRRPPRIVVKNKDPNFVLGALIRLAMDDPELSGDVFRTFLDAVLDLEKQHRWDCLYVPSTWSAPRLRRMDRPPPQRKPRRR